MRIDFDIDIDPASGKVVGVHHIDTDDPKVVATLQTISGNAAAIATAGWNSVSKHPAALANETRWAFIKRQVSSGSGPANLKALNLV